jgi:hypothetical protein
MSSKFAPPTGREPRPPLAGELSAAPKKVRKKSLKPPPSAPAERYS